MKKFSLLAILVTAAALAASVAMLKGGYVNPEAETFIPHYLSPLPLSQIVFSPEHNDWGLYQARELSYFFDWLDCRFIAFSCSIGAPHFLSVTHYAGCALIGLALGLFARGALGLPGGLSIGLMGLWLTSPCVLLGGAYYRSAKILAAAALLAAVISAWQYLRNRAESRSGAGYLACNALFVLLATLADRQGAFLGAALALWCAVRAAQVRNPAWARLAAAGLLSVAAGAVYAYWIGPLAIRHFSGAPTSFAYMSLPLRGAFANARQLKDLFWIGPETAVQEMSATVGGLPWVPLLAGIGWLGWHLGSGRNADAPRREPRGAFAIWCLAPMLALMAMYSLMTVRHEDIAKMQDFKIVYYPLPLAPLAVLALAFAAAGVRRLRTVGTPVLTALVWVLVAGNLGNLPGYRFICATSTYGAEIRSGPGELAALRARAVANSTSPAVRAIGRFDGFSSPDSP